ncbi:hypothetical protein [Xanthobacter autotrophicus]|uniref:hypothetical protein n=1 Tax=Xanthobacter autotrophicus TaxID=280 RepID=UPI003727E054
MPDAADDDDIPWSGRPQDDPMLHAARAKRFAEFRREHPPVNCWIDKVQTIDLYLDGARRALVERDRALILFFDGKGEPVSSAVYLRSENPYDVAEAHLGVARVAEVRDESDEADEILSSVPRERQDREAENFRSRHYRDVEIYVYLRSALTLLRHESAANGVGSPIIESLLQAIGAEVQDQHEQALGFVQQAASALESRPADRMFGDPALADCRRAMVAIERHIAIQNSRPIRRGPEGKSGG